MNVKPLGNRLVVRPLRGQQSDKLWTPPAKTTFNMYVTDEVTRGEIVAIGPGAWAKKGNTRIPVRGLKKGDVIRFSDSCTRWFKHDGEDYCFIRDDDVAFVEDDNAGRD